MRSLVFIQCDLSGEGFPTQTTLMGFLSCMKILVIIKQTLLHEGFPTFTTYMSFPYFLRFLMLDELGLDADEFLNFQEFHFSLKLFTVSMEKGFPISRMFSGPLDFTASALVR